MLDRTAKCRLLAWQFQASYGTSESGPAGPNIKPNIKQIHRIQNSGSDSSQGGAHLPRPCTLCPGQIETRTSRASELRK